MFKFRKIMTFVLFAGLFLMGCKDKKGDPDTLPGDRPELDLPYSQLTPDQQKAKLEQESIDFLRECNALKNLSALDAIKSFNDLLGMDFPEMPEPFKEVSDFKDVFDLTGVTGIFTWNKSTNQWDETASSTELKFIFPAEKGGASNNATLTVKTSNSGVTFTEKWDDCDGGYCEWVEDEWGDWYWECDGGDCTERETVYNLPKSAAGILTIDNKEAAKIEFGAEYKNNKEVPVTTIFKMTTNEGYAFSWTADKGTENKLSMKLSHNGKSLLEGTTNSNAKVDNIIDGDFNDNLLGKADATLKLMDNLMLVYTIDAEKFVKEMDAIDDWYYSSSTATEEALMNKRAKALNDYMNIALVSTKDKYKIADVVAKAEKDSWDDYYISYYLKFNDNTLIEASVYFGEGFDALMSEFGDFMNEFE